MTIKQTKLAYVCVARISVLVVLGYLIKGILSAI